MLFSQILDAGPAQTICPGEIVQLQGIGDSSQYFYYRWSPDSMLSNPTVLNPWVWPSDPTTYYLYGYKADSSIVVNGDFELGNTGFTSSYVYATGSRGLWPEGTYSVVNYAYQVHPLFPQTYDHTFGTITGHYMAVNGSGVANTAVWSQNLSVTPNTDYIFYTWVLTLGTAPSALAQLQFSINGNLVGNVFLAPSSSAVGWQQFYTIWNSDSSTTATITIVNQNISTGSNDFGLDDIYFAPLVPDSDSVTVFIQGAVTTFQTIEQCDHSSYVFNRNIIVESGTYVDTIQTYRGCDSILVLDITFYPQPVVDFSADKTEGCAPQKITFTNLTVPDSVEFSYEWSVYDLDGSLVASSTVKSPDFEFTESGTYHVQLVVISDNGCSDSLMKWNYIHIYPQPVAEFSIDPEFRCFRITVESLISAVIFLPTFWRIRNGLHLGFRRRDG